MTLEQTNTNEVLAWIDVETTGLDPASHALLEVACIVTDTQLNELAEPFHRTIRYPEWEAAILRDRYANDFVREMHTATGLWDRLSDGTPIEEVDEQLKEFIASVAPSERQARVAGNSVRLDLNFLEAQLPITYNHLHYRFVDVTGFEYMLLQHGLVDGYQGSGNHTALADIRSSIEQMRNALDILNERHKQWGLYS